MLRKICLGGFFFAFFFATSVAWAAIPKTLTYQGYLTDTSGMPMNGNVSIAFRLYDVSTGGKPVWSETLSVAIKGGHFSTILGATKTITSSILATAKTLYLAVKVEQDPEMSPRSPLTSVPFSRVAGNVTPGASLNISSLQVAGKDVINSKGEWKGTPTGLQGPKGDKGDKGDKGNIKTFSCPSGQFLKGITSTGAPVCATSRGTTPYKTVPSYWLLPSTFVGKIFRGLHAFSDSSLAAVYYDYTNLQLSIYYSTNGGQSWSQGPRLTSASVGASRWSPSTVVQAGSSSFLIPWSDGSKKKSGAIQVTNGGKTAVNRLNSGNATSGMNIRCDNNGICVAYTAYYVSPNTYNQIWTSGNGGTSWTKTWSRSGNNSRIFEISASGTRFYFSFRTYNSTTRKYTYYFYYSTSAAATSWKSSVNSPNSMNLQSVQGNVVYLSGRERYRTTNGGPTIGRYAGLFASFPSLKSNSCFALASKKEIFCQTCHYQIDPSLSLPYKCILLPEGASSFPHSAVAPSGKYVWYGDGTHVYRWTR